MVNKKAVIICSIIALIIVVAIVGIKIKDFKNTQNEMNNKVNEPQISRNPTKNENIVSNDIALEENKNETTENEVKQEEVKGEEETKSSETVSNETESTAQNTNNGEENGDEAAINLVKNEWGADDTTVYYTIDTKSGDRTYTISVRSKSTTEQLAEYDVNLADKTVVIK